MSNLREAATLALEALELEATDPPLPETAAAMEALRAALAEPVQPVAWMVYTLDGKSVCVTDNPAEFSPEHKALPLYTAPPQRKPLSVDEIKALHKKVWSYCDMTTPDYDFARAIEAAHGITGGSDGS